MLRKMSAYLISFHDDEQVIVLQIDRVIWSDKSGNLLYYLIATQGIVISQCRTYCELV